MGEYAEGLLNGDYDCITGVYLGAGAGYPRTTEKETYYTDMNKKKHFYYRLKVKAYFEKVGYKGPPAPIELMKAAKRDKVGPKQFGKYWVKKHRNKSI